MLDRSEHPVSDADAGEMAGWMEADFGAAVTRDIEAAVVKSEGSGDS